MEKENVTDNESNRRKGETFPLRKTKALCFMKKYWISMYGNCRCCICGLDTAQDLFRGKQLEWKFVEGLSFLVVRSILIVGRLEDITAL